MNDDGTAENDEAFSDRLSRKPSARSSRSTRYETSPHDEHQSSGRRPVKLCSDQ
jgi:hypothetical protein